MASGCSFPRGATTSAQVADAPETMPGRPPNKAQFRPTTKVLPSPTRGWTPAISANCSASGATATAVAKPALTFAAREWSSVCGSLLNNNPDNSSTLVRVRRSALLVVRFCHFRYWRKYFLLVAGLVSAFGRRRLALVVAARRSSVHRILMTRRRRDAVCCSMLDAKRQAVRRPACTQDRCAAREAVMRPRAVQIAK